MIIKRINCKLSLLIFEFIYSFFVYLTHVLSNIFHSSFFNSPDLSIDFLDPKEHAFHLSPELEERIHFSLYGRNSTSIKSCIYPISKVFLPRRHRFRFIVLHSVSSTYANPIRGYLLPASFSFYTRQLICSDTMLPVSS